LRILSSHQRFSDEETVNASSHHSANILQATKGPGGTALMQMLGVFAEFERNIIAERTKLGVRQAMADGKIVGRPSRLDPALKKEVIRLIKSGQATQAQIARMSKVNRSVISRIVAQLRVEAAA